MDSDEYIGNSDLFELFVEKGLPISVIDAIFAILRNYSNPSDIRKLPKHFKTVIGKYLDFVIKKIDAEDPTNPTHVAEDSSEFIYFGIEKNLDNGLAVLDSKSEGDIPKLCINTDGLPLFKSSQKSFWPILGNFEGQEDDFIIALYDGPGTKPKNSTRFLEDFVTEMIHLQKNGITWKGKKIAKSIELYSGHFDSPARSFVLRTPYFNSFEGCNRCFVEGCSLDYRTCFLDIRCSIKKKGGLF